MNDSVRVVLGTAGHIDHGKTALVRSLTGVDTDRLPEERARGITIDLGFAELPASDGVRLGVVDVPGHEDFVRTMVAGATGMDVVLLVVAADEGVMPQTREHLDIIRVLDVPAMVVALTKCDLVEDDWAALVEEDVRALLRGSPYADAPVVRTSTRTDQGLESLRTVLEEAARGARRRRTDDLLRLPVDRAFTVQGTGTVVTGTLWSGLIEVGDRVAIAPGSDEARVRTLQVHGRGVEVARAGERTAVGLAGLERAGVARGATLVSPGMWPPSWMLTVRAEVLGDGAWTLEHGQRVRVLIGTAETFARCAVLGGSSVAPGESGWVQLRLEEPMVARAGDRAVLRSYSPVTTMGGALVVEAAAPKRRRLEPVDVRTLTGAAAPGTGERLVAILEVGGWAGTPSEELAVRVGRPPAEIEAELSAGAHGALAVRDRLYPEAVVREAADLVLRTLDDGHRSEGLIPAVPLERLRGALPPWAGSGLADAVVRRLAGEGRLELAEGGARRPGFVPMPTPEQAEKLERLLALYRDAGLSAPFTEDLPPDLGPAEELGRLLGFLERNGRLRTVDQGLLIHVEALDRAERDVIEVLGGRQGLGPADFREVLPVSRRHLMPLLAYLDGIGATTRSGGLREVRR